jgi:peptide/nickel transport system permease protein
VGFASVLGASVLGIAIGLIAGYYRGFWDMLLMRCVDVQLALPFILIALTFISILGGGLTNIILFMVLSQWVQFARLVRGMVLSVREREYVEAAHAMGAGDLRIMVVDILPNLIAQVIVYLTLLIPAAVVFEATLSFLGLGVVPPTATWGNMLADSLAYYRVAWWYLLFPGSALLITTLAFNLLGDSVRDAFDPRGERLFRR